MPDNLKLKSFTSETVKSNEDGTLRFVLSDEKPDRDDDIVRQAGLSLTEFKKNPVALFGHNHQQVIGRWKNVKLNDKNQLEGDLELAPDDIGPFQKAINGLIRGGFLKATSIGFSAKEYNRRSNDSWGYDITKSELHEVSVVAVGANPRALSLAKSFGASDEVVNMLNAELGRKDVDFAERGEKSSSAKATDEPVVTEKDNQPEPIETPLRDDAINFLKSLDGEQEDA